MKSLLLSALLLAAGTLQAQDQLNARFHNGFDSRSGTAVAPSSMMNTERSAQINKTSYDRIDTLGGGLVSIVNPFAPATPFCTRDSISFLGTLTNDFYIYGNHSQGANPTSEFGNFVFEEFGVTYSVPAGRSNPRIEGVYAIFEAGTEKVGAADQFRANIRNFSTSGTGAVTVTTTPIGFKTFTLDDLATAQGNATWERILEEPFNDGNLVFFDSPVTITGSRFLVSITTTVNNSGTLTDDTLQLATPFSTLNPAFNECTNDSAYEVLARVMTNPDPGSPSGTYRSFNSPLNGWTRYRTWSSNASLNRGNTIGVPAIVPVLLSDFPTSRNEALVQAGGLTMYANYPNPAVTYTNIGFDMAKAGVASIKVTDIQGRVVMFVPEIKASQGRNDYLLDVSGLDCGTYTYLLTTSQGMAASKIQVVR
jgi:hypothetical protein